MTDFLDELAARIKDACDRKGKPSGVHMIDGQRMIAKHFRMSKSQNARDLADVADCMAHCIENEALLFECLKTEALAAIDAILAMGRERDALRAANGILEDALQEAGDDYPGSNMQEWCQQQVKLARQALEGGNQ